MVAPQRAMTEQKQLTAGRRQAGKEAGKEQAAEQPSVCAWHSTPALKTDSAHTQRRPSPIIHSQNHSVDSFSGLV